MELEPIVHVWINHDHDLVDVTIASTIPAKNSKVSHKSSEVIHTNQKHPFLTVEQGFLPVSQLHVGMHVIQATGRTGIITRLKAIPGSMKMYNLEIAQDHTFTVGEGEWIVHNCAVGPVSGNEDPTDNITMQDILNNPYLIQNMDPMKVANIARQEGWVVNIGILKQSQHNSFGVQMWKPNATGKGNGLTGDYVQWHEGGGYHGPDPYWKVSSGEGGTVRFDSLYQSPKISGDEDTTGGDFTEGDLPFIDP